MALETPKKAYWSCKVRQYLHHGGLTVVSLVPWFLSSFGKHKVCGRCMMEPCHPAEWYLFYWVKDVRRWVTSFQREPRFVDFGAGICRYSSSLARLCAFPPMDKPEWDLWGALRLVQLCQNGDFPFHFESCNYFCNPLKNLILKFSIYSANKNEREVMVQGSGTSCISPFYIIFIGNLETDMVPCNSNSSDNLSLLEFESWRLPARKSTRRARTLCFLKPNNSNLREVMLTVAKHVVADYLKIFRESSHPYYRLGYLNWKPVERRVLRQWWFLVRRAQLTVLSRLLTSYSYSVMIMAFIREDNVGCMKSLSCPNKSS